jgi:hypothetical protein
MRRREFITLLAALWPRDRSRRGSKPVIGFLDPR